ncbi:MAG: hypothetical protein JWR51_3423 [Devosia sp.]|uniref:hypothetical protein n=1 Tax=Devosia sp. TaxID=1871048 RepID=UPI00260DE456|nr:hypothetical protein [Devosia sp.]MDB5530320.1 hypothetical protein [Devosia sp.]
MFVLPLIVFGFYLIPILLTWTVPRPVLLAAVVLTTIAPAIWLLVTIIGDSSAATRLGLTWSVLVYLALAIVAGIIMGRIALPIARWFARVHPRGVVPTWIVAIVFLPGLAFYLLMGAEAGTLFNPAP